MWVPHFPQERSTLYICLVPSNAIVLYFFVPKMVFESLLNSTYFGNFVGTSVPQIISFDYTTNLFFCQHQAWSSSTLVTPFGEIFFSGLFPADDCTDFTTGDGATMGVAGAGLKDENCFAGDGRAGG